MTCFRLGATARITTTLRSRSSVAAETLEFISSSSVPNEAGDWPEGCQLVGFDDPADDRDLSAG
jgi:hypothetical protein